MLILLSCAKTMTAKTKVEYPFSTVPIHKERASEIAFLMAQKSVPELEKLLRVNSKIALENQQRYQVFHSDEAPELPAVLAYTGIVFKRVDPSSFSPQNYSYAQDHLRLTSFGYGLLRPLDAIKNYRLEGDIKLEEWGGVSLFNSWRDALTDAFIADIQKQGGVLCYLASEEMKRLFHWDKVKAAVRIITPEFKVWKEGKLKTVVVYAKMCRGEMTRYIIQNEIKDVEALKEFHWEGFSFNPEFSQNDDWVFTSDQI